MLHRLMGRPVFAKTDRVVGEYRNSACMHQRGHSQCVAHVIRECQECAGVGNESAVQRKAIGDCLTQIKQAGHIESEDDLAAVGFKTIMARGVNGCVRLDEKVLAAWNGTATGRWPKRDSGPIEEAPGETWGAVEMALAHGQRGLPGGSSLIRLLKRCREA